MRLEIAGPNPLVRLEIAAPDLMDVFGDSQSESYDRAISSFSAASASCCCSPLSQE